uniref:Ig-like domain-containing protein n=1 Tax=Timema douglasi TaxID=61478 RepID=A0A7R8V8Y9_TIMDO|nr:unnamed protein product [Timema douglasi]
MIAAHPQLLYKFINQTLQPGPPVSIKCIATGNPTPHIIWHLDGFPLPQNERKTFKGIDERRNGSFPKQRKNAGKPNRRRIVALKERILVHIDENPGDSTRRIAVAKGMRKYKENENIEGFGLNRAIKKKGNQWYVWRNYTYEQEGCWKEFVIGQYVTLHGDVISHVNISNVQVEDGGIYRCTASNRVGEISHSADMRVYDYLGKGDVAPPMRAPPPPKTNDSLGSQDGIGGYNDLLDHLICPPETQHGVQAPLGSQELVTVVILEAYNELKWKVKMAAHRQPSQLHRLSGREKVFELRVRRGSYPNPWPARLRQQVVALIEDTVHLGAPASDRDSLSWLEEQITALLNRLQDLGVSADDHVGLLLKSTDSTLNPVYVSFSTAPLYVKLFKSVVPLLRGGAKAIGKQALHTGIDVLSDVANQRRPFKEALRQRVGEAGTNLERKAGQKINTFMTGSRYKGRRKKQRHFQSFIDDRKEFIVKELSVLSVCGTLLQHWALKPPYAIEELSTAARNKADYIVNNLHGDANYSLHESLISGDSTRAETVYVKGAEKKKFLTKYTSTPIVDLYDRGCPSLKTLKLGRIICMAHSSDPAAAPQEAASNWRASIKGRPGGVPPIIMEAQDVCTREANPVKPLAITGIFNTLFPLDEVDAKRVIVGMNVKNTFTPYFQLEKCGVNCAVFSRTEWQELSSYKSVISKFFTNTWARLCDVWDLIDVAVDRRDMWPTPVSRYCNDLIDTLVVDMCDTLTESSDVIDLEQPTVETHIRNLDLISANYYTRQVVGLPFIRPMPNISAVAGEPLYIACPVAGYPIELIIWEKGKRNGKGDWGLLEQWSKDVTNKFARGEVFIARGIGPAIFRPLFYEFKGSDVRRNCPAFYSTILAEQLIPTAFLPIGVSTFSLMGLCSLRTCRKMRTEENTAVEHRTTKDNLHHKCFPSMLLAGWTERYGCHHTQSYILAGCSRQGGLRDTVATTHRATYWQDVAGRVA